MRRDGRIGKVRMDKRKEPWVEERKESRKSRPKKKKLISDNIQKCKGCARFTTRVNTEKGFVFFYVTRFKVSLAPPAFPRSTCSSTAASETM